jgi:hypothetical protein
MVLGSRPQGYALDTETPNETQPPTLPRTSESTKTVGVFQTSSFRSTPTKDRRTVALYEGSGGTLSPQLKVGRLYRMESLVQHQLIWVPAPP